MAIFGSASSEASIAFFCLAIVIPSGYRLALWWRRDLGCQNLTLQVLSVLMLRDGVAAAALCSVVLAAAIFVPFFAHAVLWLVVLCATLCAYIDFLLLGKIGMRLDGQVFSYASNLFLVVGKHARRPAQIGALLCLSQCLILFLGHVFAPRLPYLILIVCLVMAPCLLALRNIVRFETAWRLDGVLWHWASAIVKKLCANKKISPKPIVAEAIRTNCISPKERYALVRPSYPLWRHTLDWGSPRRFSWAMPRHHRPHVIYIVMESMGANETGCLGHVANATPHFDAWSQRGHLFTRHYAPGHSTSRSMMSALYGVYPGLRARPTLREEKPAYLHGLPQLFVAAGYRTHYLQGAPLYFDDKESYFKIRGFDEVHGADWICEQIPTAELGAWSSPYDAHLFDAHLAWLKAQQRAGQPTFSTLLTMTNHEPWLIPRSAQNETAQGSDAGDGRRHSVDAQACAQRRCVTLRYADTQLGRYLTQLEEEGILQHAIVIISGDTGQHYVDGQSSPQIGGALPDAAYHIPLLLLAPGFVQAPQHFDTLSSQIDVQATLMDLLDLGGPHHSMGQSLAREPQRHVVHFTQPHEPSHYGVREDNLMLRVTTDGSSARLYELDVDVDELHDVASKHAERTSTLKQQAIVVQDSVARLHQQDAWCPADAASLAPSDALLAQATYRFAPDGLQLPETQAQLHAIIDNAAFAMHPELRGFQVLAARVLRSEMPIAERIEWMRLQLRQMFSDSFGELTWIDNNRWHELNALFMAAENDARLALLDQVQAALKRTRI